MQRISSFIIGLWVFAVLCPRVLNAADIREGYRTPQQINTAVRDLARRHADVATVHEVAETPGGRKVLLLEFGTKESKAPGILVVANAVGDCPPATQAAMQLADLLAGDWQDELASRRWYVLPMGNPDGYARFFATPLAKSCLNERAVNGDKDDATDEDGPDDLNGDGFITMMRQRHPEGRWIPVEDNPVLLKRAEAGKGETGEYRLFVEGIDNDGDGELNEDGPGGAIPGHNFPHAFHYYTTTDGMWPASETESRGVLKFAFEHPDIAMILVFGRTNSLKKVPEGSKKSEATKDKYKLPEWMARRAGVDPEDEFTLPQLVEMGKEVTGYQDLTEEMVLQFLGVGAAVNPDRQDLPYWNEINERYGEFEKEAGLDGKRLDPQEFPDGSVEEWAYFQFGVPAFSMDFWSPPVKEQAPETPEGAMSPDDVEKMSNEEFIELGPEKISEFLKASKAPAQFNAEMVIGALKSGMMTTKKMAEFMRKAQKKEAAGGADEVEQAVYDFDSSLFVPWAPFEHPTLGAVEIGGMKPYAEVAPPAALADSLIRRQLPFLKELMNTLPRVQIADVRFERKNSDVWRLNVWVKNDGLLPFPTHQGQRCRRPTPAVVTVSGKSLDLLEGRARTVLGLLEGSGGSEKVTWLVRAREGQTLTIDATSLSAGSDARTVTLQGEGSR